MTREEAIKILEQKFDSSCRNNLFQNAEKLDYEDALWLAITALRTITQEQVEKVWKAQDDSPHEKGQWFHCTNCNYGCDDYYSHNEKQLTNNNFQFCPCCGRAVTDEAMQMVIERLEALYDTKN